MITLLSFMLLVVLSIACLLNCAHADDYKDEWKNTLILISISAVALSVRVIYIETIPIEFAILLAAVTWQNVSMSIRSWQRHAWKRAWQSKYGRRIYD